MGVYLAHALDCGRYAEAQTIAEPLNAYWDSRGLTSEASAWVDRVRVGVEAADGTPPPLGTPANDLWLFMVGAQAGRQVLALQLDKADRTYRDILEMLTAQPESKAVRDHLAVTYHQLGRTAQDRGNLDNANAWYRRSLAISEQLGDRPHMAASYHQLGTIAQQRGELDDAEAWHQRSLEIFEQLGDRPNMANSYHNLGILARDRGDLDDAEDWHRRSLEIEQQLGNRPGMAASYGQLGLLAEAHGNLHSALELTVRCVALFDEFPHPATGPGPFHLVRLTRELGVDALQRAWRDVTGVALPAIVRQFVEQALAQSDEGDDGGAPS